MGQNVETGRPRGLGRYRWGLFLILAMAYLVVYFHRLSLSVVADDLVRQFKATASAMGLLGSVYFYCYALMQIPAGLLSDSLGPRKTVTFSLIFASAGSVLFGMAPGMGTAFAGRIMVGLGVSMVFIPTMKILSRWFRAREFAFMAGILNAMGGIGVLVATYVLALMTGLVGWRVSFDLIGIFTFVLVVLVWLVVRDKPQDKGWPAVDEGDPRGEPRRSSSPPIGLAQGLRTVLRNKHFWPLALWFFLEAGVFFGLGGLWGGPYLMHVYGMTRTQAGSILSMIAWGMIVGSPLLGLFSDRVLKSRKKVLLICSALLVADLGFLNLFPSGLSPWVLYLVFLVFSVCSFGVVAIGFTATKELFPVEIAGTSVGMVNFFPFLGGAIFMPLLGRVLDAYPKSSQGTYSMEGYTGILLVLLVSCVAALLCTALMKETLERAKG